MGGHRLKAAPRATTLACKCRERLHTMRSVIPRDNTTSCGMSPYENVAENNGDIMCYLWVCAVDRAVNTYGMNGRVNKMRKLCCSDSPASCMKVSYDMVAVSTHKVRVAPVYVCVATSAQVSVRSSDFSVLVHIV